MGKILSQAGVSLADVYDVEGSIVGVDELITREVHLQHEMGAQIFSERLRGFIIKLEPGAIAQNTSFSVGITKIPDSPNRLIGVQCVATNARISNIALYVSDISAIAREILVWSWDVVNDQNSTQRWSDDGGAVGSVNMLRSTAPNYGLPLLITRTGDSGQMPELNVRGTTAGFGAGTVTPVILCMMIRANPQAPVPGDPRSHGLPVPSW